MIYVEGMMGLGDNIHQRAAVRQLMSRDNVVLETCWPCVYHDLVGAKLQLTRRKSTLRTQAKNEAREAAKFANVAPPKNAARIRNSYSAQHVRETGSVLAAMLRVCGCDISTADFRMPIPDAWKAKAGVWLNKWRPTKPLLIYRPLNERSEWKGCANRNPDHAHYAQLFRSIKDRYFVVSVADFQPNAEWLVGEPVQADATCHAGELDFETLAALTRHASLVFTSPGFAVILAQAVGTPAVCVFGGYEDSRSFSAGAKFTPYLGIDPIRPCQCWSHTHACDKRIDMPQALARLDAFTRVRSTVAIEAPKAKLPEFPPRYFNPGELDVLVHLIGSVQPKTVIEFGCNEGRAAATILHNLPSVEEYVGIDVLPGYVTIKECQRKEIPVAPGKFASHDARFRLIVKKRGAFDLNAGDLPMADAAFIDADHSRLGVLNDYGLAKQAIRPGGIIIFHDDNRLPVVEVSETLDELHRAGATIMHVQNTWLAFERVNHG